MQQIIIKQQQYITSQTCFHNNMHMKARSQQSTAQMQFLKTIQMPQSRDVGTLTPVHIDDIIKDRNLDYLENLGELVERMPADPIWYQYQTLENKCKFLQVYQISINYSKNTETIYSGVLQEIQKQFKDKKQKVDKLKMEILEHKQKTQKMKKNYKREKLHKQKQKALHYQKNLKKMRDNLIKQKRQLEIRNQIKIKEERQRSREKQEKNSQNPFGYLQKNTGNQFYQHPPPPQYYPYPMYPPPQMYPPPPEAYPPPHFLTPQPQQYYHMPENPVVQPSRNATKPSKQVKFESQHPPLNNQFSFAEGGGDSSSSDPNIKNSTKSRDPLKNSWALKSSDPIRESNIESEREDTVEDLNDQWNISQKKQKLDDGSKMSRKSSGLSGADIDSMLEINLKTQSKGDLDGQNLKGKLVKRTTSIVQSIKQQQSKKPQKPQKPVSKQDQKSQLQDPSIKNYSNNMSVKITKQPPQKPKPPSLIESVTSSSNTTFNYLEQSNQGQRNRNHKESPPKINKNLKLKASSILGKSSHSLDDESKYQSKAEQNREEDNYDDDFEVDDEEEEKKTRVKVHLDPSVQSPERSSRLQFVPLYKNYFVLKQDIEMGDSRAVSSIGSLKQFSVKFIGNQKKKVTENKSRLVDDQDIYDLIQIPMESRIAKPSQNKLSTIRKSTIHQKIAKSYDPKKQSKQNEKKQIDFSQGGDSFVKHQANSTIQSKVRPKQASPNTLPLPKANQPPLRKSYNESLPLEMTQSHVITEQVQQQDQSSRNEKLDMKNGELLSIIPESQNESYHTHYANKNKNILNLIEKKFRQKGKVAFDKDIIKNQINSLRKEKGSDQLSWEQVYEAFQELSKRKKEEVTVLIKQRMNAKSSKESSKENSGVNKKNSNTKIPTIQQKQKQQDDLTYSVSVLQGPPLLPKTSPKQPLTNPPSNPLPKNPNSKNSLTNDSQKPTTKSQLMLDSIVNPSSLPQTSTYSPTNAEGIKTKYARSESRDNNQNRMLDKILQASKFDQDDPMGNDIKNNFGKKIPNLGHHKELDQVEVEIEDEDF